MMPGLEGVPIIVCVFPLEVWPSNNAEMKESREKNTLTCKNSPIDPFGDLFHDIGRSIHVHISSTLMFTKHLIVCVELII